LAASGPPGHLAGIGRAVRVCARPPLVLAESLLPLTVALAELVIGALPGGVAALVPPGGPAVRPQETREGGLPALVHRLLFGTLCGGRSGVAAIDLVIGAVRGLRGPRPRAGGGAVAAAAATRRAVRCPGSPVGATVVVIWGVSTAHILKWARRVFKKLLNILYV